jgi:hypothetical protein|tara:strand:+ start:158 stop:1024 length:867 start_codon:yes stop_codon:yes gene_type:complete
MSKIIKEFIKTFRSEILQNDTEHAIFHGCWDWHSSVHGHWALLESAHFVEDKESLELVSNRLTSKNMEKEIRYLRDNPEFEMPYGRAWYLRLMMRLEQITGFGDYKCLVQEIALDLREWIDNSMRDPSISEYNNPSWALIQLHAWATHFKDSETVDWGIDKTKENFMSPKVNIDLDREGKGEFFSLWGLQTYLIYTALGADELAKWLEEDYNLDVVKDLNTDHHLAINASRAWGFHCAYLATSDSKWKVAYDEHVQDSIDLHPVWKNNRRAYAHWVPQFTLYAMLMGN